MDLEFFVSFPLMVTHQDFFLINEEEAKRLPQKYWYFHRYFIYYPATFNANGKIVECYQSLKLNDEESIFSLVRVKYDLKVEEKVDEINDDYLVNEKRITLSEFYQILNDKEINYHLFDQIKEGIRRKLDLKKEIEDRYKKHCIKTFLETVPRIHSDISGNLLSYM